jgi:hypothetical protein
MGYIGSFPLNTTAVQGTPMGRINSMDNRIYALEHGSTVVGVAQIVAGTNVTISPAGGTGTVTINATGGSGSGFQLPLSGSVNGSNQTFTWATTPKAIVVDGQVLQSTDQKGNVYWNGTTTTVLTIPPTQSIFAVA